MRLRRLLQTLRTDLHAGTERSAMTRSAAVTAGLQLLATIVSFGSSLLYARVLGPHGFGLYAYVTAWATPLAIPAALGETGLPGVREGAGRPGVNRDLRRWADGRVLAVGGERCRQYCAQPGVDFRPRHEWFDGRYRCRPDFIQRLAAVLGA